METILEKGLASHSSNMVAPHDYHCEPEKGWAVVTSKKNLHKLRKSKKIFKKKDKNEVIDVSSGVYSVKLTTSDDSS